MSDAEWYIALNRFGYGANSKELPGLGSSPIDWLLGQLKPISAMSTDWSSVQAIQQVHAHNRLRKQEKTSEASAENVMSDSKSLRRSVIDSAKQLAEKSVFEAIMTDKPFQARLRDFFSNHFSVSYSNLVMTALAPTLEREAIGPRLTAKFSDMLIAVEQHPAMLNYLNNARSIGPKSKIAKRRKGKGLNENLAREILELHTLGVSGGYQQHDVIELAKGISGWSIGRPGTKEQQGFFFRANAHEPGERILMNKPYRQEGQAQGIAMLRDLANHPSTAKHLSMKLARHFIADTPPDNVVSAMTDIWLKTDGDLHRVLSEMLRHPESWKSDVSKYKSPRDFFISTCRACHVDVGDIKPFRSLQLLGQPIFASRSPTGYGDIEETWAGPTGLMNRIEWSQFMSRKLDHSPMDVAELALGPLLKVSTRKHILNAESKRQGNTLWLMSPEFQYR